MPYLTPDLPGRLLYLVIPVPDTTLPTIRGRLVDLAQLIIWDEFGELTIENTIDLMDQIDRETIILESPPSGQTGQGYTLAYVEEGPGIQFLVDTEYNILITEYP